MSKLPPILARRTFLKAAGSAVAVAAAGASPFRSAFASDSPLTVGVIYVGARDDYGYNQSHAQAAAAIKKMPGIKVVEEEMVPETVAVEKTMEAMIEQDGAKLIFATSFGYFPHVVKMAAKYHDVRFAHCGGLWTAGRDPMNVGSFFGYIDECEYVSGIVAGYATKTKKLGFIAAKPIPQVLRNINSFTLGAQSVDPSISTHLIFTGDWSMPVKEAEAANSLIDQGCDVLTCHVDGPKVIVETCEKRGVFCCGYHVSQAALAPKGYLTGAEWNWATPYKEIVMTTQADKPMINFLRGGLKEGFVRMSPYGNPVSEKAKGNAGKVKEAMLKDNFTIFKGPIKDNDGKVVIPTGESHSQQDIVLEQMNYLVSGVVGKV